MGLLERIKSALGLGTSASSPSNPSSTPEGQAGDQGEETGPTPVSEIEGDEQVEATQTVVDPGDGSDDVDVTVEHEPDTSSEDAVKAADTAATGTSADVESVDETDTDDAADTDADDTGVADARAEDATDASEGDAPGETDMAPGAGVDLEEVKGIGPAYADRLRDAGVEDVAALASADAADLADRSGLGEGRVRKWIDRADAR